MKLLGARLAVKVDSEETTESGIILVGVDHKDDPHRIGVVTAIGNGTRTEEGALIPMDVQIGDRVVFAKFTGVPIEAYEKDCWIINERDILAIL